MTKILIVEDNRDTLRTYARTLLRHFRASGITLGLPTAGTETSIEVETADLVGTALDMLRAQRFDLLIVDLMIRGIAGDEEGGFEVIDEALRIDPIRPIIVVSGYSSVEKVKRSFAKGAFDFIEKQGDVATSLLDAVQRALDDRQEKIRRSGNPFNPMTGIEPTVFGGRQEELAFFEERLNRALHSRYLEHFVVLGDWGIGKSTLVNEYRKICLSRDQLACVVPLESLAAESEPTYAVHSLVEGILRDLPFPIDRLKKVIEYFDSVGISILGSGLQVKRDVSRRGVTNQAFLHDALIRLWSDLKKDTDVFVVLLDDLDNFSAAPEIVTTLKQTLSMRPIQEAKIVVGMTSTYGNWHSLTHSQARHPLNRFFMSQIPLGPLTRREVEETVVKSLAKTGISFTAEVIERVFQQTGGHPFEMQVLCYYLFRNHTAGMVDTSVWGQAIEEMFRNKGLALLDRWHDQATEQEIAISEALVRATRALTTHEILRDVQTILPICTYEDVENCIQRLVSWELLSIQSDKYLVSSSSFRAYVQARNNPDPYHRASSPSKV